MNQKSILALGIAIALGGCAIAPVTNPNAMEAAETAAEYLCMPLPFQDAAPCVRAKFFDAYPHWQDDANADLVYIFLAWAEAAGARVYRGELSDADAKAQAQTLHARLNQIAYNRQLQRQINSLQAQQMMLAGLAILSAAYPPPPAYGAPITCTMMGSARFTTVSCL